MSPSLLSISHPPQPPTCIPPLPLLSVVPPPVAPRPACHNCNCISKNSEDGMAVASHRARLPLSFFHQVPSPRCFHVPGPPAMKATMVTTATSATPVGGASSRSSSSSSSNNNHTNVETETPSSSEPTEQPLRTGTLPSGSEHDGAGSPIGGGSGGGGEGSWAFPGASAVGLFQGEGNARSASGGPVEAEGVKHEKAGGGEGAGSRLDVGGGTGGGRGGGVCVWRRCVVKRREEAASTTAAAAAGEPANGFSVVVEWDDEAGGEVRR